MCSSDLARAGQARKVFIFVDEPVGDVAARRKIGVGSARRRCGSDRGIGGALQDPGIDEIGLESPGPVLPRNLRRGKRVVIIAGVKREGEIELAEILAAGGLAGGFLGAGEGGQKKRGQDADDGNDDEQFDERERPNLSAPFSLWRDLLDN